MDFENRVHFLRMMDTVVKTHADARIAADELQAFLQASPSLGANPFFTNSPLTMSTIRTFLAVCLCMGIH